jgi:hypothetical protein
VLVNAVAASVRDVSIGRIFAYETTTPSEFRGGGYVSAAAASAGTAFGQTRLDGESRPMSRLNKINREGFDLLKKLLVYEVSDPVFFHNFIIPFWLIQSHTQRGPRSPTLGEKNPDNCFVLFVLEKFLNFLASFRCNLKHYCRLLHVILGFIRLS